MIAITRSVSPSLTECELTHLDRVPINIARAVAQHAEYQALLGRLGCTIVRARPAPELPDAVFIEDTAVVLDEVAIVARPGASSRRSEVPAIMALLAEYRPLLSISEPGTLDGGDVLRLGRTLYVGRSSRTNEAGIEQLRRLVRVLDYEVVGVDFTGCLHLKSAVTELAEGLVLYNPDWVSRHVFDGYDSVAVDPEEPHAANALRIGETVVYPSEFSRTRARLLERNLKLELIENDELAKAEGGVSCCSLIFSND